MAMLRMMKRGATIVFVAAGMIQSAATVRADYVAIHDRNSSAYFETDDTQFGMYGWDVDYTDHMYQQWFWFRVGSTGPEMSLDSLTQLGIASTDTNPFLDNRMDTLSVLYGGSGFMVDVTYTLRGGSVGSGDSDIGEQITIINTGDEELDFHFFQYSDFDLNQSPLDSGLLINGSGHNTATQTDGQVTVGETVVTPGPSHYAGATFPTLLNLLNDAAPTTLPDIAGPLLNGDFAWAFQWDFILEVGDSFVISKDKQITDGISTPAPGAAFLGALGLGLVRFAKRRVK
jgi:hypothetical protein